MKKLLQNIYEEILFVCTADEFFVRILTSALGIKDLGTTYSDPYRNYYSTNPLVDSWKPCVFLVKIKLMKQDEIVKTQFAVAERGLRFLQWLAKRTKDDALTEALTKVSLND